MIVQVATFRDVVQEGEQQGRLFADGIKIAGSFLLGGLSYGQRGEK
jgi:hypothetical protein